MTHNANTAVSAQSSETTKGEAQNANVAALYQAVSIIQGVVTAANNAASIAGMSPLQRFLHTIIGLNQTQCVAVSADRYEYFMEFENMQWDSIENFISTARKRNLNRGELSLSAAK